MTDSSWRVARAVLLALAVAFGVGLLAGCNAQTGISGTITAHGAPAVGTAVEAFTAGTTTNPVASTTTADDGTYTLDFLRPGVHHLRVAGTSWYDGTDLAGTTPADVTVTLGSHTSIDLDLAAPSGAISGTADLDGTPTQGITVDAIRPGTGAAAWTTTTGPGGSYTLRDLTPGAYLLRFSKAGAGTRWHPAADQPNAATPVTVTADVTVGAIDGHLTGARAVTGTITNGHIAIPGAIVAAVGSDDATNTILSRTTTGPDGRYVLPTLNPTTYRLFVAPPNPYRWEGFGTRSDPYNATVTDLTTTDPGTTDLGPEVVAVCDPVTFAPGTAHPYADLTGVDLRGCDLTGVSFVGADLTGANLEGTSLAGANLALTTLTAARSGGVTGSPLVLPAPWRVVSGHLIGPGADLAGSDLSGADLDSANLVGADLTGADISRTFLGSANLTGADLTGADVHNTNLFAANLTGADLSDADLTQATLILANLTGTDLSGSTLQGVTSAAITGTPTDLPAPWRLIGGALIGPGASVGNVDLSGADLVGMDLTGANLVGASLRGADLTEADLTDAVLVDVDLTEANLTDADLTGATVTDADLTDATLTGVTSARISGAPLVLPGPWQLVNGHLLGPGAGLAGADLAGFTLYPVDLTDADLRGADLSSATIGADLTGADLTGADLTGADLTATLTGADLTGADLTGIATVHIVGTPLALPSPWRLVEQLLIGPGARLPSAHLPGVDLSGASLSGADLSRADLAGADLTGADLTDADLAHADLAHADLDGADLSGADLTLADLTGAHLTGAGLSNTSLPLATLLGVRSGGITGVPAVLPSPWRLVAGHLVGPGADLADAELEGADLAGVDLTDADLDGADVAGADLAGATLANTNLTVLTTVGVRSGGLTGTPRSLPGFASIVDGYLVGPGADLTGAALRSADLAGGVLPDLILTDADLDGADLRGTYLRRARLAGADLTDAVLVNADLTSADLTGADLGGADLTGAQLTGVTSSGITGTPVALPAGWSLVGGVLTGP